MYSYWGWGSAVPNLKYKEQFDKKSKAPSFREGQKVWLYCTKRQVGLSPKMCNKWLGPYYISEARDNFTYKLRRCSDNKLMLSPVHANRLKQYHDPEDRPRHIPNDVDCQKEVDADQFEDSDPIDPAKDMPPNFTQSATTHVPHPAPVVLGNPQRPSGNNVPDSVDQQGRSDWFIVHSLRRSAIIDGKRHYQVKWKGYNKMTWEPEENIPDELIQDFHIRKTKRSKAHKRRR